MRPRTHSAECPVCRARKTLKNDNGIRALARHGYFRRSEQLALIECCPGSGREGVEVEERLTGRSVEVVIVDEAPGAAERAGPVPVVRSGSVLEGSLPQATSFDSLPTSPLTVEALIAWREKLAAREPVMTDAELRSMSSAEFMANADERLRQALAVETKFYEPQEQRTAIAMRLVLEGQQMAALPPIKFPELGKVPPGLPAAPPCDDPAPAGSETAGEPEDEPPC